MNPGLKIDKRKNTPGGKQVAPAPARLHRVVYKFSRAYKPHSAKPTKV
jgi:hypothetical protein